VDRDIFHVPTEQERQLVQARLGLHGTPYVAFLGMLEPRKNVPSLVRGWVKAVEHRESPPALVLAGGSGWDDEIDQAITQVPSHLRVLRPGYLKFSDLRGFLGGATVVAYPSHGEGFGLPVLEAMACGAAVLTTQRLSLPEVGGDAVAYTEGDPDSIAVALARLLDDPEERRRLGEAAVKRAAEFTWAASAEAHLASFARALSG
jgi:glycosyltransferase involved in cell wall biosynthesis